MTMFGGISLRLPSPHRRRWAAPAVLAALALAACSGDDDSPAPAPGAVAKVAAFAPAASAQGVVVADAALPRPASTPCTVTLFNGFKFIGFDAQPFSYPGTAACTGPFAKVVLEADYAVNAGRQFDRTALISIGGMNLYFGTTQEPSSTVAPTWHVERDVTDYANALAAAATGYARLDNVVDTTYTGVLTGSARLVFYPAANASDAVTARIADSVLPFAGDLVTGDPKSLASATDSLSRTLTLPTNLVRVYLDVFAESQGGDEFQYTCVTDELASVLQSCGGGSFREVLVTVDGQPAGLAPVVPRIYTGGIDPGLWRPTPGVEALNFIPSRIDLTPFAGVLSDGKAHTVAISVEGAQDHFAVIGNLLLYRDAGATTTGGAITSNTLASGGLSAPVTTNAIVSPDSATASGTLGVKAARSFVVAGYVDTSRGRISTRVEQSLSFSNQQTFNVTSAAYTQAVDQLSTLDSKVTTTVGAVDTVDTVALRYPLTLSYTFTNATNTQVAQVGQSIANTTARTVGGAAAFSSSFKNAMSSQSTSVYGGANGTQRSGQKGSNDVTYSDSIGSCFDRHVVTASNALASFTDGTACAGGNALNWLAQPDGAPAQSLLGRLGSG